MDSARATDARSQMSPPEEASASQVPAPDTPGRPGTRADLVVLGCGLVGLVVAARWFGRGLSFVVDEWDILAHHVHGDLLTPYNGHLSIVPIAIYQGFAHTVGVQSYVPYALVALVVFLAIPIAFAATHRRLVDPALVVIAALGLAWSWAAEGNILYGFLVNFDLPILMLVVGWWLIRGDTLRHDLWAMAALAVALATSSVGVVVAFALGVELLLGRAPLRRLIRFALPVVLWGLWWVFDHEATKPASVGERLSYAWHTSVAILAGFTLGWKPGAAASAVVIVIVVAFAWRRWRTVDAHVVAIGATLVFFVALSAFSRAGDIALNPPDSARYVWVGDVLIIAGLVWCVRGRPIRPAIRAAAAAVVLVGAVGLVGNLADYRSFALGDMARTHPFLVGAEAAGPRADPARILPLNLIPVTVGEYLDLVASVGSPVAGAPFSSLGSESARLAADRLLIGDERLVVGVGDALPRCAGSWRAVAADGGRSGGEIDLPAGAMLAISAPERAEVRMRRLARGYPPKADVVVPAGRVGIVRSVRDGSKLPWWVHVDGRDHSLQMCAGS